MKLSEAWSIYKSDKQLEGYSPYTIKGYELQHKLFVRSIGDIDINEVTYEMIKSYLAKDIDRLKPSSIAFRMKYFKSLFRYLQDEGHIVGNPAHRLKEPKIGQRIPKALSEETLEMLRESCETSLEHALVEVLFTTGCRIGEIHRLKRNDINWETRSIIVNGKGNKQREVYFTVKCAIWLKEYLKSRKDNDMALFVTERRYRENGNQPRPMSIDQFRWILKRIAKRASIEHIYPHLLRHTYATHLLNNQMPLEIIQEFMGHSNLSTTRLYAQLSGERRRELYRRYF